MLRKLLACLALLTGLAAAGAPAQAEVVQALASHCEASTLAPAADASVSIAVQTGLLIAPDAVIAAAPAHSFDRSAPALTVRIGSDRARE